MILVRKNSNLLNAILYSSEGVSALLFSLVSISLIARHFGPEQMARYNVAQSISAMLVVVATLGFDQFIIRELARKPRDAEFATSTQTGLLVGWLGYALLLAGYYAAVGDLSRDSVLIISVAISTFFMRVLFIKGYLQAQHDPKPIAVGALISRLVAVMYLFVGTVQGLSFEWMMLYLPLQGFVMFAAMVAQRPQWLALMQPAQFSSSRLWATLREAWPVFVAAALFFFYSQSDIVLMSHLLDDRSVGVYSAAIRLIPLAAFIGFSLLASFYRELERRLALGTHEFEDYARKVLAVHFAAGLVLALSATLFAAPAIHLLYGPRFAESSGVLKVAAWAWVFIMPAALYSRLLVMLGLARYELIKMLLLAPTAVALNYLAISKVGMLGAAAVCVIAYMTGDFLVYALFKPTRRLAQLGMLALGDVLLHPLRTFRDSRSLLAAQG